MVAVAFTLIVMKLINMFHKMAAHLIDVSDCTKNACTKSDMVFLHVVHVIRSLYVEIDLKRLCRPNV